MRELVMPDSGTPEEQIKSVQRTPSLTDVMKSMITVPATG